MYKISSSITENAATQTVVGVSSSPNSFELSGLLSSSAYSCKYSFTLQIPEGLPNQLSMDASVDPNSCCSSCSPPNRLSLLYYTPSDEQMFGMGMQYTDWNLRGQVVPVLTSEQGIGRGRPLISPIVNRIQPLAAGTPLTQYGNAPHLLTSALRTLYLTNSQYSEFDLASSTPNVIAITTVFRTQAGSSAAAAASTAAVPVMKLSARVFASPTPLAAVGEYTLYCGRMKPLPDWAVGGGAVVGLQGGNATVMSLYSKLKAAGVPIAALWIQDWSGKLVTPGGSRLWWNWVVDGDYYPDWTGMLLKLQEEGTRVLSYINPYLENTRAPTSRSPFLFQQAQDLGYLVKNSSGQPYILKCGSVEFGTMDFTNPDAKAWYAMVMQCNMLGLDVPGCDAVSWGNGDATRKKADGVAAGVRLGGTFGWMADFGEYLPFDAVLHSGDAAEVHNLFPQLWSQTTQQALAGLKGHPDDGQVTPFHRSQSPLSPGQTTLFWEGDQLVTWDKYDGIGSAVLAAMTGPLSGFALMHSDIGGYTMFNLLNIIKIARSQELLLRWMELSAFADSMFRSHQGLVPDISSQVYSNNVTMAYFALTARWHAAIAPYRQSLMEEHVQTGAPLVRHPWLQYWDTDPEGTLAVTHQFMLGPHLMMAPVITKYAESVDMYLPKGSGVWSHMWTGVNYTASGNTITLQAPSGSPAVLVNTQFMGTPLHAASLAKLPALREEWLRNAAQH